MSPNRVGLRIFIFIIIVLKMKSIYYILGNFSRVNLIILQFDSIKDYSIYVLGNNDFALLKLDGKYKYCRILIIYSTNSKKKKRFLLFLL